MNIIETREKLIIQRMEFQSDFNQIFPINDHADISTNEDNL